MSGNHFTWSQQRQDIYDTCARKYYYHYYAYWGAWQANATQQQKDLWRQRKLVTLADWPRVAAQRTIASYIDTTLRPPFRDVLIALRKRMSAEYANSRELSWRSQALSDEDFFGLVEHSNGYAVTDDQADFAFVQAANHVTNAWSSELWRNHARGNGPRRMYFMFGDVQVWSVPELVQTDAAGVVHVAALDARIDHAAAALVNGKRQPNQIKLYTWGQPATTPSHDDYVALGTKIRTGVAAMTKHLHSGDIRTNVPLAAGTFKRTADTAKCVSCPFRTVCTADCA